MRPPQLPYRRCGRKGSPWSGARTRSPSAARPPRAGPAARPGRRTGAGRRRRGPSPASRRGGRAGSYRSAVAPPLGRGRPRTTRPPPGRLRRGGTRPSAAREEPAGTGSASRPPARGGGAGRSGTCPNRAAPKRTPRPRRQRGQRPRRPLQRYGSHRAGRTAPRGQRHDPTGRGHRHPRPARPAAWAPTACPLLAQLRV